MNCVYMNNVSIGISFAEMAEGSHADSNLQEAIKCFKNAKDTSLQHTAKAHLASVRFQQKVAGYDGRLVEEDEREGVVVICELLQRRLLGEARALCDVVGPRSRAPAEFESDISQKTIA